MARRMTTAERSRFQGYFPRLAVANCWVLGEQTRTYNCLAWALGITNAWVWPWGGRLATPAEMTTYLRGRGYVPQFGGPLATYGPGYLSHAARFTNAWTSKVGSDLLISHGLTEINGGVYGVLRQQYARRTLSEGGIGLIEGELVTAQAPVVEAFGSAEDSAISAAAERVSQELRAAFEAAITAWEDSWTWQPIPPLGNESFAELMALGDATIPLLVDRLRDPDKWPAIYILEHFLPAELTVTLDPDDPDTLLGEQFRARATALSWARSLL
jgi:hypothetical protein